MLRLGANVTRHVAQAQGNAAMTVQRMEEALDRQESHHDSDNDRDSNERELHSETLLQSTSLTDAARRPRLPQAVDQAYEHAKRQLDSYNQLGGEDDSHCPLGRLAKKAKLQVGDFQNGLRMPAHRGSGRRRRGQLRPSTASGGAFLSFGR
uniref:Uncharacterized protein n=1 Tax=Entomoneis paludosa TaxID=265537 RepID=A0A7S2YNQ5_9STRA